MHKIVVYSTTNSSRLTYVLDWLLQERLQISYSITTHQQEAVDAPCCITYGAPLPGKVNIPAAGLLAQGSTGTPVIGPATGTWQGIPVLFAIDASETLPFDILSAIFYLISRYEEYLPYTPDKHARYPATESVLYKNGWLQRPVVDEWVHAFRQLLERSWRINLAPAPFIFRPSYDIDMAYSHAYKGIKRIVGAYIKALLKGDVAQISQRTQILKKKVTDPYDSFAWIRQQHERNHYKPLYFILSALRTSAFDRNIHPKHPAMMRVIKQLAKEGEAGIHPSYYATHYDRVAKEKNTLHHIIGRPVTRSRQHYIRLVIPATYHVLMDNDITDDYSMGYGTHLGFRAGTGASFPWYDLKKEAVAPIRIHPFCFMDTTAHFDMHLPVESAFEILDKMAVILKTTNSTLVTIFHNFSLGTDPVWRGWSNAYEAFLARMANS